MTNNARRLLTEASLLPAELPDNFTFNRVRGILDGLEGTSAGELARAVAAAVRQKIGGPLAALIFIKHHLAGAHEVEVDRVEEGEGGAQFGVLVYDEGEVPVRTDFLPENISTGSRLRYDPLVGKYRGKED